MLYEQQRKKDVWRSSAKKKCDDVRLDGPLVLVNGLLSCKMVSFVGSPTITLVDNSFLRKINGALRNKWKW